MCGGPANSTGWLEPGWMHGAVMAGLPPSTPIFYQYGDPVSPPCTLCMPRRRASPRCTHAARPGRSVPPRRPRLLRRLAGARRTSPSCPRRAPARRPQELGWSPERSFVSPPAPGAGAGSGGVAGGATATVRLLAVADLGQAEVDGSMGASEMVPSLATTARLAEDARAWGAGLLVHNGDVSCEPARRGGRRLPGWPTDAWMRAAAGRRGSRARVAALLWLLAAGCARSLPHTAKRPMRSRLQTRAALAPSGTPTGTSWALWCSACPT